MNKWTDHQIAFLKLCYPDTKYSIEYMCTELGKTESAIRNKANKMDIQRESSLNTHFGFFLMWDNEQIKRLKYLYAHTHCSVKDISIELEKSIYTIKNAILKLGLTRSGYKRNRNWTTKEICFLKEAKNKGMSSYRIAAELGRTPASIENALRHNGLYKRKNECIPWSKDEEDFLKRNVSKMHTNQIAKVLHKSITSIDYRIRKFNLYDKKLKIYSYYNKYSFYYLNDTEKQEKINYCKFWERVIKDAERSVAA